MPTVPSKKAVARSFNLEGWELADDPRRREVPAERSALLQEHTGILLAPGKETGPSFSWPVRNFSGARKEVPDHVDGRRIVFRYRNKSGY